MTDPMGKVTEEKDWIDKIQNFVAKYIGYFDKERRRDADKMLRSTVASRFQEQWDRISSLQEEFVSGGNLEFVDDLEKPAVKLRGLIDRIQGASYGYAGFFDAVRIQSEELNKIYQFDYDLLQQVELVKSAVDQLEAAIEEETPKEAIDALTDAVQNAIELYNRRDEVILAE
jgi:hypothetical protein